MNIPSSNFHLHRKCDSLMNRAAILQGIRRRLSSIASKRLIFSYLYNPYVYLNSYRYRNDYCPVFIFATPRTGSNLLSSLLNGYEDIVIYDELLNTYLRPYYGRNKNRYLKHLSLVFRSRCTKFYTHPVIKKNRKAYAIIGTKIFPGHLQECNLSCSDIIQAFPRSKIILLYRRDLILQYVSVKRVQKTRVYFSLDESDTSETFHIDEDDLRHFCEKRRSAFYSLQAGLSGHPELLTLSYEDLAADYAALFKTKVCPFLGLQYKQQEARLKKQNPDGLTHCRNREEIQALYRDPLFMLKPED